MDWWNCNDFEMLSKDVELQYLEDRLQVSQGTFWSSNLTKEEPIYRLEISMTNLPRPYAFRNACIALRKIISIKVQNKEHWETDLALLYELAVVYSFWDFKKFGFSTFEKIPGNLIRNLPYSYKNLGYTKLELLKKRDIDKIRLLWGEPDNHQTLIELHEDFYQKSIEVLTTLNESYWNARTLKILEGEDTLNEKVFLARHPDLSQDEYNWVINKTCSNNGVVKEQEQIQAVEQKSSFLSKILRCLSF